MVDEAEKEANRNGTESDQRVEEEGTHREPPAGRSGKGDPYMSPLSSMFIDTPLSRLWSWGFDNPLIIRSISSSERLKYELYIPSIKALLTKTDGDPRDEC